MNLLEGAVYDLDDCKITIGIPVEVGRESGHFWFGKLHAFDESRILCDATKADDKAQGKWPSVLYFSQDGGRSWRKKRDFDVHTPVCVPLDRDRLLLIQMETRPIAPGDMRGAHTEGKIVTIGEDDELLIRGADVKFLGFPYDLADYHIGEIALFADGNILPLKDGRLLTAMYRMLRGETNYKAVALYSEDGGFTWRFLSEITGREDGPGAAKGSNESNIVRLEDGRLLCISRVAGGAPYIKSLSSDEGITWTKPETMIEAWSVEPQLVRLANGLILLSGGRPGILLWVCADGQGERWQRINLAEHHNEFVPDTQMRFTELVTRIQKSDEKQTTSYTSIAPVGPEEVLISYDRLANGWEGAPGPLGDADAVFTVRVRAER